mmetsp:Transcript_7263/g.18016  ORF Transcript_7263/g.18016 Transcript_7263/m.18016 type:complete len:302 (-) Transcript_7263:867-1772(-)
MTCTGTLSMTCTGSLLMTCTGSLSMTCTGTLSISSWVSFVVVAFAPPSHNLSEPRRLLWLLCPLVLLIWQLTPVAHVHGDVCAAVASVPHAPQPLADGCQDLRFLRPCVLHQHHSVFGDQRRTVQLLQELGVAHLVVRGAEGDKIKGAPRRPRRVFMLRQEGLYFCGVYVSLRLHPERVDVLLEDVPGDPWIHLHEVRLLAAPADRFDTNSAGPCEQVKPPRLWRKHGVAARPDEAHDHVERGASHHTHHGSGVEAGRGQDLTPSKASSHDSEPLVCPPRILCRSSDIEFVHGVFLLLQLT